MESTFSKEKYDFTRPFSNGRLSFLYERLDDLRTELRNVTKEIREIQDGCEHTFFFVSEGHGPCGEAYICSKCGHETQIR